MNFLPPPPPFPVLRKEYLEFAELEDSRDVLRKESPRGVEFTREPENSRFLSTMRQILSQSNELEDSLQSSPRTVAAAAVEPSFFHAFDGFA